MLYELLSMDDGADGLSNFDDDDLPTTPTVGEGLRCSSQDEFLRSHPRAVLNEAQAIEIYQHRRTKSNSLGLEGSTAFLAKKYSVSPKTIRDIWNRRTWIEQTRHLWTDDEKPLARKKKPIRPKARDQQQNANSSSLHPQYIAPCFSALDLIPFAFAPLMQNMYPVCGMLSAQRPEPAMSNTTFAILSALLQSCPWPGQPAHAAPPNQPCGEPSGPRRPRSAPQPAPAAEARGHCGPLPPCAEYEEEEVAESVSAGDLSPANADGDALDAVWACDSDDGDDDGSAAAAGGGGGGGGGGGDGGGGGEYDGGILTGFDELDGPAAGAAPAPADDVSEDPFRADSDWPLW